MDPIGWRNEQLAQQKSLETGMPLSFKSKGKQYTLKPDLQMQARLQASEKESARRAGRKEVKIEPTFRYVDPSGKPFEGMFMGTGSYGGFGKKNEAPQPPELSGGYEKISPVQNKKLTEETQIESNDMGEFGSPLSFTGFGGMARTRAAEQTVSPIGQGFGSIGSGLFGAPRFPFAGSKSAFERGSEYTTFGGLPRFPFANY